MSIIGACAGASFLLYKFPTGPVIQESASTFDGDSLKLKTTLIVPTLDTLFKKDTNAIWCASFLSAWKCLESDLAKEPLMIQDSPEIAVALNKSSDPRPDIPKASLYVASGWNQKGIIDQITKDLAQKFPSKTPPVFDGIAQNSFVTYAYLEVKIKFSIPYFQNRKPLLFTDCKGNETVINSFGICPGDESAYLKLRQQPAILFAAMDESHKIAECIIDLDHTSNPNQIILALVEPGPTLEEMLKSVEEKIAAGKKLKLQEFDVNDVLLVPDIIWNIRHRFTDIEGKEFMNSQLKGQRIDVARQDIQFRLDKNGSELRSEAEEHYRSLPTQYAFDRPFLLYMKERGAKMPYFVMWIANAELLCKWTARLNPKDYDEAFIEKIKRSPESVRTQIFDHQRNRSAISAE